MAPPLIPNTGPSDGSLNAKHTLLLRDFNASARPIDTVVLPIPALVGLIAVTSTSFFLVSLLIFILFILWRLFILKTCS